MAAVAVCQILLEKLISIVRVRLKEGAGEIGFLF